MKTLRIVKRCVRLPGVDLDGTNVYHVQVRMTSCMQHCCSLDKDRF